MFLCCSAYDAILNLLSNTHAMVCYAMLCYAMLCYAMLCYATLYYITTAITDRAHAHNYFTMAITDRSHAHAGDQ